MRPCFRKVLIYLDRYRSSGFDKKDTQGDLFTGFVLTAKALCLVLSHKFNPDSFGNLGLKGLD